MQNTSALYKSIINSGTYWTETQLSINGFFYGENKIISMTTSGGLFKSAPTVGNCISRQIDIEMLSPDEPIPPRAELRPYVRVVNGSQKSEWIPKGIYYIDTREVDVATGKLTITGYDRMLMLEQPYITDGEHEWFAMTDIRVMNAVLERFNIELDPRTSINKGYAIGYPGYGEGALTCREVLGYIGGAYCGNWIFTDDGKLRLVKLGDLPEDSNLLLDEDGNTLIVGGDRIIVR